MFSTNVRPTNVILITFVCIYIFASVKLLVVDFGLSSDERNENGPNIVRSVNESIHSEHLMNHCNVSCCAKLHDLEIHNTSRLYRESLEGIFSHVFGTTVVQNNRNLSTRSYCTVLMEQDVLIRALNYGLSKENHLKKVNAPNTGKVEKQNSRNRSCHSLGYSSKSLPVTALASFPGSGNTWVRHLLQEATGKD